MHNFIKVKQLLSTLFNTDDIELAAVVGVPEVDVHLYYRLPLLPSENIGKQLYDRVFTRYRDQQHTRRAVKTRKQLLRQYNLKKRGMR